ncbi:MAG: hypothetical protein COV57_01230 [Candidatus Liptonbacteria bacterium CG11_big_fil_rev_8_21_14_0_20_35_14]|uniref:Uncharacterized protein n=1 Tax=Candidatus Liptonbacteria bacterium CG11_big_fil_rev_8_21_14_0_20_35_14 TaxID=1974634 RepID=A0A2H0N822_9BACT|nr:MAG: hypothetical protein COV57_01230 [Candidatus Liptonbacteria bacterium CG11_big_fil_rev_8_21_14_0_20_35_14]
MKKISFPTENRQFRFEPKNPYDLVAERRVPRREDLTFPDWCRILKIVRTHFAACGGEESPPQKIRKAAEPHR